jgi:hypothetical protein
VFCAQRLYDAGALRTNAAGPAFHGSGETEGRRTMDDEPKDILMWVDAPKQLRKSDELTLKVLVKNARTKQAFTFNSVDLHDDFLDGFSFVKATPEPDVKDHSDGFLTLEYDITLAPGDSQLFKFDLKPKKSGVFIGDVDVWEAEEHEDDEDECVARAAQIEILR